MKPTQDVIAAAQVAERVWKIPASVSIGQFALESGWGRHMPPGSNNPFGIKAVEHQAFVTVQTHEFVAGRYVAVQANFRKFDSLEDAFEAHAGLLATAPVYANARARLPDVELFVALMAAHYATDPHYADELMAVINADGLRQYDEVAA
jgi:flagellum-specific peptidoglycan hydrolase FlgJ